MRRRDVAGRIVLGVALAVAGCAWQGRGLAQENSAPGGQSSPGTSPGSPGGTPAEAPPREVIDLIVGPPAPAAPSTAAVVLPEIKIPNFVSCTIAELKGEVPELGKLKATEDQSGRTALLDKIGEKVVEMAQGTPNLVSDESVLSERDGSMSRQNFSFLLLHHASKLNTVVVDEYRVDPASGDKFETEFGDDGEKSAEAHSADLRSLELNSRKSVSALSEAPHSTGFFSQWLNFYPANRRSIDYRYLGEEKIHGRRELIVAFAQKPGIYPLPLSMEDNDGKVHKLYMQGVAWVDAKDFRIVRLRTGILSTPPAGVRGFTVEVEFAEARVATMNSALWLPSRVVVTTKHVSTVVRETHTYSHFRLFRAKSRLVLDR